MQLETLVRSVQADLLLSSGLVWSKEEAEQILSQPDPLGHNEIGLRLAEARQVVIRTVNRLKEDGCLAGGFND